MHSVPAPQTPRVFFSKILLTLTLVTACNDKPTRAAAVAVAAGSGAAADAASVQPVSSPAQRVVRYDAQRAMPPTSVEVVAASAVALSSIPDGEVIATLKQGDKVEQAALFNGFYLVRRPGSNTDLGWIVRFAFESEFATRASKASAPLRCTDTKVAVLQDQVRCAYVCKTTLECADVGTCEAAMLLPSRDQPPPATPLFTTVCTIDPTRPVVQKRRSLFGAPRNFDGGCPVSFKTAPELGKLCYRSCDKFICPHDAECKASKSGKFCYAQ
jgi:hypothetical protein